VLPSGFPTPQPDRLVQLTATSPLGNQSVVSIPKYLTWRDRTNVFEYLAAYDIAGPAGVSKRA
jgi:hypothetical protein